MAAVIFFGAVSCAKEDISSSLAGGEVEVTFTANLPELGTRAYGDGANATLLRYYVYDGANGAELEQLSGIATTTNGTFSFTLPLIKGMTYDFVLWADKNVGDVDNPQGFYAFDGKIATINYNGEANNNARDAFYGFVDGFDPVRDTPKFYLHRPFAQLNAATSDKALVAKSGVELTTSTIAVKAYDKFDVTTGDIAADANLIDVAFTAAPMPCNLNPVETLKSGFDYLSMNYLLVPKGGMNVDVAFTFNGTKGIVFEETEYTNVPLKQNYRTNILGALLTKQTEIEVEILPGFGEPAQDVVMTAADLKEQIENAPAGEQTEIVLGGDIDLNDLLAGLLETRATTSAGLIIPEGKEIILNLGGYTLSQTKECTAHYAMISNKGSLTVVNGTVSFDDTGAGDPSFGWGSYTIENRGNLVIEEGAVVEHLCDLNTVEKNIHMYCAVQQASGTTTVNGGVISTPTYRSLRVNGGTATFNGGVFEGQVWMHPFTDSTALTINGGEFAPRGGDGSSVYVENSSKAVGLTVNGGYFATKIGSSNVIENAIHGGLFDVDPTTFKAKIASDCFVMQQANGKYVVVPAAAMVGDVAFASVQEAINKVQEDNAGTVVLNKDVVIGQTINIANDDTTVVLDLNGHNLSYAVDNSGKAAAVIVVNPKANLQIVNTHDTESVISFVAEDPDLSTIPSYATNTITNEGTLNIGANVKVYNGSNGGASYAVDNKGKFTLEGGKLVAERCALRIAKFNQDDVQFTMASGLVEGATPAWIQLPGSNNAQAPKITVVINGGTFQSTKSEDANVLYTYSYGNSHANTNITINGGEFLNGTVSIGSGYKGDVPTLTINGGTFDHDVIKWLENDEYEVIYQANN